MRSASAFVFAVKVIVNSHTAVFLTVVGGAVGRGDGSGRGGPVAREKFGVRV